MRNALQMALICCEDPPAKNNEVNADEYADAEFVNIIRQHGPRLTSVS